MEAELILLFCSRLQETYTEEQKKAKVVHFPSCMGKEPETVHWRYLCQIAAFVGFSNHEHQRALMAMVNLYF